MLTCQIIRVAAQIDVFDGRPSRTTLFQGRFKLGNFLLDCGSILRSAREIATGAAAARARQVENLYEHDVVLIHGVVPFVK